MNAYGNHRGGPARADSLGTMKVPDRLDRISIRQIEIGGEFGERIKTNTEKRLKAVNVDRLTAPFTHRKAPDRFDGAWIGEHAGKFLDAASKAAAHSGDPVLFEMARRCAEALINGQAEDGYLGTCADSDRWSDWDVWTHKYCIVGLLSYWRNFGDNRALAASCKIADHLIKEFGEGSNGKPLASIGPHRGMVSTSVLEPVCALFEATGEARYLAFAEFIGRGLSAPGGPEIVSSLLDHGQTHRTANGKAYEMLSNLCGLVDLHRATGNSDYFTAVEAAWSDIVLHQLYETGTVSACEHFQPPGQLLVLPSSNVGETCATVTWLQLNQKLWLATGNAKYAHEIERSVYNHLFAAQDRESGDFCYYTPLVGKKEYTNALLCCVSSGARGIALLPELVLAIAPGEVVINLYTDFTATVTLAGADITIKATSQYPTHGAVDIRISAPASLRFLVRLRAPTDASGFTATVDGQSWRAASGAWLDLDREWSDETTVRTVMTLETRWFGADRRYGGLKGLKRGPQVFALEASENPAIEDIGRVALPSPLSEHAVESKFGGGGRNTVALNMLAGRRSGNRVTYSMANARLTPFADARDFTALMPDETRAKTRIASATALQRCAMSHEDPYSNREAISDEEPGSFATLFCDKPSVDELIGRRASQDAQGRVWFAVAVDLSHGPISRIIFRHGAVSAGKGAFDASRGLPFIEAALSPLGAFYEFLPDFYGARWTPIAALSRYPSAADAALQSFKEIAVQLNRPIYAHAIRVIGWPVGAVVTCAELSGWG